MLLETLLSWKLHDVCTLARTSFCFFFFFLSARNLCSISWSCSLRVIPSSPELHRFQLIIFAFDAPWTFKTPDPLDSELVVIYKFTKPQPFWVSLIFISAAKLSPSDFETESHQTFYTRVRKRTINYQCFWKLATAMWQGSLEITGTPYISFQPQFPPSRRGNTLSGRGGNTGNGRPHHRQPRFRCNPNFQRKETISIRSARFNFRNA